MNVYNVEEMRARASQLQDDGDGHHRNWARILVFGVVPLVGIGCVLGGMWLVF